MMGALKRLSALFLLSLLRPGLSRVLGTFSECNMFFLKGKTPNIPDIILDNGKVPDHNHNRYKPICQHFKGSYRFATLYDTTNRIPVFSAYKFTGDGGKRPNIKTWMIEPQLDDINAGISMSLESEGVQYEHQARNSDYIDSEGVNKGHLFSSMHAPDTDTKESTFTLTNAVPQVESFNNGSWSDMEKKFTNIMKQSCKVKNSIEAYVVTGAVPSQNKPEKKLNHRVNIPSFMWMAYCCEIPKKKKIWHSGAFWGENTENAETNDFSVAALHSWLKKIYKKGDIKVFPQECLTPY